MDITKIFEPIRGIVEYLISRLGTFVASILLIMLNFDFSEQILLASQYTSYWSSVQQFSEYFVSAENKNFFIGIIALLLFVGLLEAHAAMILFLDRASPISFIGRPGKNEPFPHEIGFIWKYYCEKLSLDELITLHRIRKSIETPTSFSYRIEIFDYISGWIFLIFILCFFLWR